MLARTSKRAKQKPKPSSEPSLESLPLSPISSTQKSDDEIITEFARRINAPRGYVEFEFNIMKKLYSASPALIIELYDSVLSQNTLSTFKLRYVRMNFRSIQNKQKKR